MYITVIGLEIHAELLTKSKIFCTCSAEFGGEHNTRCCPGCTGMPGTLPMLNHTAVEYAVKAGLAMDCDINRFSTWDRKNYFYPDLPKAYQNSQLPRPLCIQGNIVINADGKDKTIRINRIHLEEDAGKLIHDDYNNVSLADYNRGSIGLIEIVTEPDFRTAGEVRAFVEEVALLLKYSEVCDAKMEEGHMRVDVNISLMKPTDTEFGTRAEIKNLNSLKSIVRAIEYEVKRQSKILDDGGKVVQETRRFNDNHGDTKSLRTKVDAHDYRYFPDPDIPPIRFTESDIETIKNSLPELPASRLDRYVNKFGLSETDAKILITDKAVSDFFNETLKTYNNPKSIANFIIGELLRRINLGEVTIDALPFTAKSFAELVELADTDKVSKNNAKTILRIMLERKDSPRKIAEDEGMWIVEDTAAVDEAIDSVIASNDKAVAQYISGDVKVFGFLMGQCSKLLKGAATPKTVKEAIEKKLEALK